jgi:uncharacterized membrane protein YfhO
MRRGHDHHTTALVESPQAPGLGDGFDAARSHARIASFRPERIEVDVEASGPALLVLAEAWYPGWEATVSGQPAVVEPANAWMRAVRVPAGHSRVMLTYRSTYLLPGAGLSAAALLALALAALRARRG